ncbi:winged helix-turn-helix domain-containing protein [Cognatishimia sp. F0-27]|uniref:winged helix-turn-helix domain-containing protein n=1 Tax=Cognatishimia sp. F0-27 TaxID=2816855 RepID=UPI001D0CC106|nr:winged helix-turn-helix domain-containing protein [Cognatishimia sp. F0-27]MCC1494615.1 winged helix-turn-helix domain-containing protein [Cognatishimia sp. F0-27]
MSTKGLRQFSIDTDARRFEIDGAAVAIGARAFDVLAFLDAHADRVVSKQELLETVWGGLSVEEGNLTVQISALRKLLGTDAIATVPGVGYKLTRGAPARAVPEGPALPEKPSIAVLPFANLTGDPAMAYLVDGIVSDLIAGISRMPGLFVIAASSSFKYKGEVVSLRDVGTELGVRYVLEGSIQMGGNALRITTQLVEAETGHTIWSERFGGSTEDMFALQDEITERTAAALEPTVIFAEAGRARHQPTDNIRAYDLCLQAAPRVMRVATRAEFDIAMDLLDRALALDPDYAFAKALVVRAHVMGTGARAMTHDEGRKALPTAYALLDEQQTDPLVLTFAGHMVAYLGNDHELGYRAIQRAKNINPNSVMVRVSAAWVAAYMGHYRAAIEDAEAAYRLNPLDPNLGHCRAAHGYALMGLRLYPEAVDWLEKAIADDPSFGTTQQALAAAYELNGQHDKACAAMRLYLAQTPDYTLSTYRETSPFIEPALRLGVEDAMQAAGLQ